MCREGSSSPPEAPAPGVDLHLCGHRSLLTQPGRCSAEGKRDEDLVAALTHFCGRRLMSCWRGTARALVHRLQERIKLVETNSVIPIWGNAS